MDRGYQTIYSDNFGKILLQHKFDIIVSNDVMKKVLFHTESLSDLIHFVVSKTEFYEDYFCVSLNGSNNLPYIDFCCDDDDVSFNYDNTLDNIRIQIGKINQNYDIIPRDGYEKDVLCALQTIRNNRPNITEEISLIIPVTQKRVN